jgi:hypothetical protein
MSTVGGGVNIVTNGLVLYLDASNTKSYISGSTTWNDVSRSGNNGTLVNGPTFNSANGGSIVFDGVDDFVSGSCTTVNANVGMTTFIWVRTTISSPQVFFSHTSGVNNGFRLEIDGGQFLLTFGGVANYSSGNGVSDGNWKQLAATTVGTSGRIYINGNLVASPTVGTMQGIPNQFVISGFLTIRFLNGNVASTSLYNRALSASEVLQNFNATKSRFGL